MTSHARGPDDDTPDLVDAYERVLRHESARAEAEAAPPPPPRRRVGRPVAAALLAGCFLWLLIAPPAWVLPAGPPPSTPAEEDQSGRLALFLESQRIEAFRVSTGRLPHTLSEVGDPIEGASYLPSADGQSYLLRLDSPPLAYRSTDSLGALLTNDPFAREDP